MADWTYTHIAAAPLIGTQILSGPGQLHSVVINSKGGSSNLLTLYDTTGSGTCSTIAIIDTTSAVGDFQYEVSLIRGLLAFSAAGTGADITVVTGG